MELSQNSLTILRQKYLLKNEKREVVEKPEDCFRRAAKAIARAEDKKREFWEEKFYQIMANLEFLPGGRTLANAGTNYPQLANCFVLPMEDNIEEIFQVVRDSSILKKHGGGVGFSFSKIRPKGDLIAGTSGRACGPVALMKVLDSASEIFLQDGKRRSGNMIVLSVSHPDILDFITAKQDENVLNQVNYSLSASDKFMRQVLKNGKWDLVNPRTGKVVSTVNARSIFELATTMAWKNGDPGLLFMDRINKDNPTPFLGPIEAVNLCGEQPLLPYEACNLGSINLTRFLHLRGEKPAVRRAGAPAFGGGGHLGGEIDWEHLEQVVRLAVRFLDDVISVCHYPLAQVDRVVKGNRKIGLGIMGWHDFLIKMRIPYDSLEALKLSERVMKLINEVSHQESQKLGREKGSFPNFANSIWKKARTMRNATTTTIAPTGSIAMVAGVSSGIEPLFGLSYYKEVLGGARLPEINQELIRIIQNAKIKMQKDKLLEEIKVIGSIKRIKELPIWLRRVFTTACEVPYEWHVKMQAAFQKYTDNAVSKTINLASVATVEDVEKAFILAWRLGCKGITIYRDQSRKEQVLNIGSEKLEVRIGKCPNCGQELVRGEGCLTCPACGYSVCEV